LTKITVVCVLPELNFLPVSQQTLLFFALEIEQQPGFTMEQ